MARLDETSAIPPQEARWREGDRKIVLIGFMGSGKSTVARLLAVRLGCDYADADVEIERVLGEPIGSFFDREGEDSFREREAAVVENLLGDDGPPVVALGGGAVVSEQIRTKLQDHIPVYLEVDGDSAWKRARSGDRPLARDRQAFVELLKQRLPLYESLARATVPSLRIDEVDRALTAVISLCDPSVPRSVRLIWATSSDGGYPVYVGAGACEAIGVLWPSSKRTFLIADERVSELHGEGLRAALRGHVELAGEVTIAGGEADKTLARAEEILRRLAATGLHRDESLLALGGGVVGDLAGFCAATYQRGVDFVQIPTSLVAQVDSAYGGKTAVDLPEGKNYVGAFHQPSAVITDPQLLTTLPAGELAAGYAEVVKTGLIAGGKLWSKLGELGAIAPTLEKGGPEAAALIEACLRTKLAVVSADEADRGIRASLNLGHTVAHALESATGYQQFRHGEAVGLGLLVALRISEHELGLDPQIRSSVIDLMKANGLPVSFEGPLSETLLEHADRDKKRRGADRNLVLLRAPGDVMVNCEASDDLIRLAVEEIRLGEAEE